MSASSQPSTTLAAANLPVIFDVALNEYKSRTGQDPQSHPFAIALGVNNSPDAILEIFRRQAQALDNFRQQHERLMACLSPIVNILFTFSAALGEGIGLAFSPAGTIFTGIGILLGTVKDLIASYEKLVQLFERIHFFLQRLNRYTGIPLPPDMIDLLGKIMAQVLSVLAHSTTAMKEGRTKKFLKRLIGRTDEEDALYRLDMLTKEENLMTAARNLEVTHRVDDNVKENMKLNHHIVQDLSNVKDRVTRTERGAQTPLNSLGLSLTFFAIAEQSSTKHNVRFFPSSHCPSSHHRR
ncbi:hypothetical protein BC826DRAFT_1049730 [Russula brevipes]|nr:hypothetical protein BC826DRAFT_1049730 [Russula brevipes]